MNSSGRGHLMQMLSLSTLILHVLLCSSSASETYCDDEGCYESNMNCTDTLCKWNCAGIKSCSHSNINCNHNYFQPNPSTRCTIHCTGRSSCRGATIFADASAQVAIDCDGKNACLDTNIIILSATHGNSSSSSNVTCDSPGRCDYLSYSCDEFASCGLTCSDPASCKPVSLDCSLGGYCHCHGFCEHTFISEANDTFTPPGPVILPTAPATTLGPNGPNATSVASSTLFSSETETTSTPLPPETTDLIAPTRVTNVPDDLVSLDPTLETSHTPSREFEDIFYSTDMNVKPSETSATLATTGANPTGQESVFHASEGSEDVAERVTEVGDENDELGVETYGDDVVYLLISRYAADGYLHLALIGMYGMLMMLSFWYLGTLRKDLCSQGWYWPKFESKVTVVCIGQGLIIFACILGCVFNLFCFVTKAHFGVGDREMFVIYIGLSSILLHGLMTIWMIQTWKHFNYLSILSTHRKVCIAKVLRSCLATVVLFVLACFGFHFLCEETLWDLFDFEIVVGALAILVHVACTGWAMFMIAKLCKNPKSRTVPYKNDKIEFENGCKRTPLTSFYWLCAIVSCAWILQSLLLFLFQPWHHALEAVNVTHWYESETDMIAKSGPGSALEKFANNLKEKQFVSEKKVSFDAVVSIDTSLNYRTMSYDQYWDLISDEWDESSFLCIILYFALDLAGLCSVVLMYQMLAPELMEYYNEYETGTKRRGRDHTKRRNKYKKHATNLGARSHDNVIYEFGPSKQSKMVPHMFEFDYNCSDGSANVPRQSKKNKKSRRHAGRRNARGARSSRGSRGSRGSGGSGGPGGATLSPYSAYNAYRAGAAKLRSDTLHARESGMECDDEASSNSSKSSYESEELNAIMKKYHGDDRKTKLQMESEMVKNPNPQIMQLKMRDTGEKSGREHVRQGPVGVVAWRGETKEAEKMVRKDGLVPMGKIGMQLQKSSSDLSKEERPSYARNESYASHDTVEFVSDIEDSASGAESEMTMKDIEPKKTVVQTKAFSPRREIVGRNQRGPMPSKSVRKESVSAYDV